MTASPIGASTRFIPEGVTKFYWVPTMVDYTAPTSAELNTGSTDLTPEIASVGDWAITSGAIDVPDLATTYTPQIPGKISVDGSTINMYADAAGSAARTLMARNNTGYIVKFVGGNATGKKCDIFPVKVGSAAKPVALGDPAQDQYTFYVTKVPKEDYTIPA